MERAWQGLQVKVSSYAGVCRRRSEFGSSDFPVDGSEAIRSRLGGVVAVELCRICNGVVTDRNGRRWCKLETGVAREKRRADKLELVRHTEVRVRAVLEAASLLKVFIMRYIADEKSLSLLMLLSRRRENDVPGFGEYFGRPFRC